MSHTDIIALTALVITIVGSLLSWVRAQSASDGKVALMSGKIEKITDHEREMAVLSTKQQQFESEMATMDSRLVQVEAKLDRTLQALSRIEGMLQGGRTPYRVSPPPFPSPTYSPGHAPPDLPVPPIRRPSKPDTDK